jgi:hypothetical protein
MTYKIPTLVFSTVALPHSSNFPFVSLQHQEIDDTSAVTAKIRIDECAIKLKAAVAAIQ